MGDMETPIEAVYAFYRYWDSFKTWREFSQYDEYDTEEAQDRYEKRWMEQQNKRGRKGYEKDERKILIKMSTRAWDFDPRIKIELAREKLEKAAIKQAKKDAHKLKYVDLDAKKKEEEAAKLVAAEAAKLVVLAEKEAKKLRNRKYRETVKSLAVYCTEKMSGTNYDRFYVDELVKKYPKQEDLEALIEKVKSIKDQPTVPEFVHEFLMLVDAKAALLKVQKEKEAADREEERKKAAANV